MLAGFARRLLYRAASALERHGDENYYFLGFDAEIDHASRPDLLLKALGRRPSVAAKFRRLVELAAESEAGPAVFAVFAAATGAGVFGGVSREGQEYLVAKAYRRGTSLRTMRVLLAAFCDGYAFADAVFKSRAAAGV